MHTQLSSGWNMCLVCIIGGSTVILLGIWYKLYYEIYLVNVSIFLELNLVYSSPSSGLCRVLLLSGSFIRVDRRMWFVIEWLLGGFFRILVILSFLMRWPAAWVVENHLNWDFTMGSFCSLKPLHQTMWTKKKHFPYVLSVLHCFLLLIYYIFHHSIIS